MTHARAQMIEHVVPEVYRVSSVRRELEDVATIEIEPESATCPAFLPGQFNMLYALGVGEAAISISEGLDRGDGFVHTIREVGAVSRAITGLEVGASLGLRGPFGSAWPLVEAEGSDVVIVAGGLGLAPLRPAIQALLARRERYGKLAILVGCRAPESILFRDDLEQWRQQLDIDIEVTVDHASGDWRGNVGVVPSLIPRMGFEPDDSVAFVCGPEVMMRFTANALLGLGVSAKDIFVSMERNMKCAVGLCGHCQFGSSFICKDGPVLRLDKIAPILASREI